MDIRLLSDTDPRDFINTLKRIANDTAVHWVNQIEPKTKLQSPINTDLFHAIEKASHERNPDVIVTTPMFTAATDRPTYRKLGIVTYGFDPFLVENEEMHSGMHGNNERLAVVEHWLRHQVPLRRAALRAVRASPSGGPAADRDPIRCEPAAPQGVADDHDVWRARLIFFDGECTAELW